MQGHVITSFEALFPYQRRLYIVEELHASYWREYGITAFVSYVTKPRARRPGPFFG